MLCGRGESFRATTCFNTVVGGKQGHVPCNVVEVKASGPLHVLILWLGVSKVMFIVMW